MRPLILVTMGIFAFVVSIVSSTGVVAQPHICAAVLAGGVFDTTRILDIRGRTTVLKNSMCSKVNENSSVTYEGFGFTAEKGKQFCAQSFSDEKAFSYFEAEINTASKVILNAFGACVESFRSGLIHYVTTTPSPGQFTYTIKFANNAKPYETRIGPWTMIPDKGSQPDCQAEQNKKVTTLKGQIINNGGLHLNCKREENQQVVITATAESGGVNTERVVLPAYEKPKLPPCCIPINEVMQGKAYTVLLDHCPPGHNGFGTILCGYNYSGFFIPATKQWHARGQHTRYGANYPWTATCPQIKAADQICIFGREFQLRGNDVIEIRDMDKVKIGQIALSSECNCPQAKK